MYNNKKTEPDFIHSFIPPKYEESGATAATRRRKIEGKISQLNHAQTVELAYNAGIVSQGH